MISASACNWTWNVTPKAHATATSSTSSISMTILSLSLSCGATAEYSKTRPCCHYWIISFIYYQRASASGNLLLSEYLDHYLKDKYGIRHFYRYCDDGRVLCGNKQENWLAHGIVHEQVEKIDLEIKKNERVFPSAQGIDFLGYVTFNGSYSLLRKRVKKKYARKLHKVKSRKRRRELIASFYGMAKHACCRNLFYKLTGKKMKSFKDLNVAYKPEDGKKRFAGAVVSIRELVNLPIVVKDFEVGVKTSQGEDRCVVSIEQNGEPKKFFTNSEEMKNILQQVSEMPDGFPFETTIKAETFGKGRTKYIFT